MGAFHSQAASLATRPPAHPRLLHTLLTEVASTSLRRAWPLPAGEDASPPVGPSAPLLGPTSVPHTRAAGVGEGTTAHFPHPPFPPPFPPPSQHPVPPRSPRTAAGRKSAMVKSGHGSFWVDCPASVPTGLSGVPSSSCHWQSPPSRWEPPRPPPRVQSLSGLSPDSGRTHFLSYRASVPLPRASRAAGALVVFPVSLSCYPGRSF